MRRLIPPLFRSTPVRLHRGTAPKALSRTSPRAVIVGAGFGGLAAAIRLAVRGYRVTVLDRLDQAGGRARVFREKGFVFDAGPTVITAPTLFDELWEIAGARFSDDVDLRPVTPFYRIRFHHGGEFDYTGSSSEMETQIRRISPADVEGYRRFLAHSERIFRVGFEQLAHAPFDTVWDMARVVPAMMELESYRTVYDLVSKYIRNEDLRQVLSFHPLLVGGNPFSTTSIYALIAYLERQWGVHFAMGGTGQIVRGMTELIGRLGGTIRLSSEVKEIVTEGRRAVGVRLDTGEFIGADIVVCNADPAWAYRHLLPNAPRETWTDARIERSRYSMSLFVWYFGTDRKYEDVKHHTILLGPRYEGLLKDIFDRKILAKDFSLYLHRPTATDPSLAPDGCDAFYVLSPVPNLDAGVDWERAKVFYRNAIMGYLEKTVLPDLGKHLVCSRMLTPRDFREDYLSFRGAAFGFEPVLTQSAWFRPHNRSEDIEHLYFVGAGTHPGAGVPGVLSSARVLDSLVPDPERLR